MVGLASYSYLPAQFENEFSLWSPTASAQIENEKSLWSLDLHKFEMNFPFGVQLKKSVQSSMQLYLHKFKMKKPSLPEILNSNFGGLVYVYVGDLLVTCFNIVYVFMCDIIFCKLFCSRIDIHTCIITKRYRSVVVTL